MRGVSCTCVNSINEPAQKNTRILELSRKVIILWAYICLCEPISLKMGRMEEALEGRGTYIIMTDSH